MPTLRLTPYAWAKLLYLRDCGDTEVGEIVETLDHPGEFVARHVRELPDVGIAPHPSVPVAAADAGSEHADDHAAIGRSGIVDIADGEGSFEGVVNGSAHGYRQG